MLFRRAMPCHSFVGLTALLVIAGLSGVAAAQRSAHRSIGTYSQCSSQLRGNSGEIARCKKCLNSGDGFYNYDKAKKKWVCGSTSDMQPIKPATRYKPPPRPTAMPKTGSDYKQVPAGTFKIGMRQGEDGNENHEYFNGATVTLSRPFMMKATEVTHAEWYFVMGALTWEFDATFEQHCSLSCPVRGVTWREALQYLNALSKLEKLEPCYDLDAEVAVWKKGVACEGYRLPTEAEWEYAARGGDSSPRYGKLDDIAWYSDNHDGRLRPVAGKKPNAYGLFDMLGNVGEWTWDQFDTTLRFEGKMVDPVLGGLKQSRPDDRRVVRGSGDTSYNARVTHRLDDIANTTGNYGLRPVRTVKTK
jgi:formylglycine-generating enzyme required for sulfatase activity